MVRIDRSTPPEVIRAFRAVIGGSQEDLSQALGLGENAIYRYEHLGAPRWMRYALLGMAVAEHHVSADVAERLLGLNGSSDPRGS
jgi:transcriptional regulator with XRE-family HTH domain